MVAGKIVRHRPGASILAAAAIIGILVLQQIPTHDEMAGIALVIAGVALHRGEAR